MARLIEKEVLNRLAVLILRGGVQDGEIARVVMEDGRVTVLANHAEGPDDDDMLDEEDGDDAVEELEIGDGDMDLYDT